MFGYITIKVRLSIAVACLICTFSVSLLGEGDSALNRKLSSEGQQILREGRGATWDTAFVRIGTQLSQSDFLAALYGTDRANRRIALDAAAYVEDPWPVIPYLVSFIEAAERQASSAAANSLFQLLSRTLDVRHTPMIPLKKQAEQLSEMLVQVAKNVDLDTDLRVSALALIGEIQESTGHRIVEGDALFQDETPIIQQAALALVTFPMEEVRLHRVVGLATEQSSPAVHGTAVAMVCENAISHNILKPSDDLQELIRQLFNTRTEEEALTPVLGCLARFPYASRASLTDKVLNCGNEKVIKYWKALTQ